MSFPQAIKRQLARGLHRFDGQPYRKICSYNSKEGKSKNSGTNIHKRDYSMWKSLVIGDCFVTYVHEKTWLTLSLFYDYVLKLAP